MNELNRKSVDEFREAQKTPVAVVLDNIRSMHNVGSVFRTADAFLIEKIYLCGYTPQPPHRDIHKTALGATETVRWHYAATATDAITALREQQYNIWAVEQTEGSLSLNDVSAEKLIEPTGQHRIAVVLGNEVNGVEEGVLKLCHGCIEIPQAGMKHSLNISVAAGIVLWELFQKTTVPAR
ncbi:MAG: RNA methyltransferase [Chitinophagaceae bacterium]|nr:RNA methyltransferase [Chitinophagaceae bacterium]